MSRCAKLPPSDLAALLRPLHFPAGKIPALLASACIGAEALTAWLRLFRDRRVIRTPADLARVLRGLEVPDTAKVTFLACDCGDPGCSHPVHLPPLTEAEYQACDHQFPAALWAALQRIDDWEAYCAPEGVADAPLVALERGARAELLAQREERHIGLWQAGDLDRDAKELKTGVTAKHNDKNGSDYGGELATDDDGRPWREDRQEKESRRGN